MAVRRGTEEQHEGLPLETLSALVRAWRRHWDEVGAIQRSLPRVAKDRLGLLSADLETALAQTRHLFALEFAPEAVAAVRARLDEALSTLDAMTGGPGPAGGRQRQQSATDRLAVAQLTVNVRDVLSAGESLEMHLQPIVALDRPMQPAAGYEALARFRTTPYEAPNIWLERASRAGLQHELELSCVRAALSHLPALPEGTFMTVNVSPETLVSEEFERIVAEAPAPRLVVEVTEHAVVREYELLQRVIGGLRERGLRLAVDDAGAGFASFRHVLELGPEIIKLDTHLIRGIHQDRNREALVRSLVSFADDVGATLVAEGIETREELAALRRAKVPFGQGYLFAQPGPVPTILRRRRTAVSTRQRTVGSARSA